MTLSLEDGALLQAAGFTEWEIAKLAEAETIEGKTQPPVELGTSLWQRVLTSRRDWIDDKISRGWSRDEITENIADYYARSPKRNPFDFLKAEYKPRLKRDFYAEIRGRNQRKVKATLKEYPFSERAKMGYGT